MIEYYITFSFAIIIDALVSSLAVSPEPVPGLFCAFYGVHYLGNAIHIFTTAITALCEVLRQK